MAGYPAFRKAGFKEMGRLEVNLHDYAEGVKWVKDGKEEDWGHTPLGTINTSQSPEYCTSEEANA
jgi:hypothetical protein